MTTLATNGSPPSTPVPGSGSGRGEATGASSSLRRLASDLVERARFAASFGKSFQGADGLFRRDLNVALGYKAELKVEDYRARYERGGIAERLIELMPRETWGAAGFDLVEDPDPGTSTPFEEAFVDLADRLDLWSRLLRADIVAGWGRYSAILIGADGDLETPLPRMAGPDDVLYLKVLAEDRAKIHSLVKESKDSRFGEPEFYTLNLGGEETGSFGTAVSSLLTKKAHWSRIIHVAEGLLEDDVYGKPRLRTVWNYLDDLAKIAGGGAEATWKRLSPLTLFDKDPEIELTPEAEDALEDEIEEIVHDLRSYALTSGVTPHILSQAVQSFGPNAHAVLDLICATEGVPKRIFLGSERGELASTQDRNDFTRGPVDSRRQGFAAPLVRRLVDRLIEYGALPEPAEYEVVLPALDELPEGEQAEIVAKFATANQANVAAGGGLVVTANEMRDSVLSLGPIEEIEDTGTEALDEPEEETEEEPVVAVNASLKAAKLRLCAARGLTFRRAEFDLADTPADEPEWKAVHRAADLHRDSLARAVLGAWEDGGDAIDGEALETALANGDQQLATAYATAGITASEDRLAEILPDRLLATLVDGGLAALRSARSRGSWFRGAEAEVEGLAGFTASFDSANPRAIDWAADRSSALITEIGPETVAAMRELIASGISEGIPPRKLARQIRQAVGLRSDQVTAVQNLIARMRAAKPGDLIKAGKTRIRIPREGVTEALIDKRSAEYGKRLRQQRALLISRSETMRSANAGQKELWLQAQESGQLPTDIEREWIVTPDDRLRPEHAAMAGQRRRIDEPFVTAAGRQLEPGEDPNCILSGEAVSGEFVAGLKAAYAGPAREIQTAGGNRVRLTINHPVLTSEGLIPAGELRQGMKLLGYCRGVGIGREADAPLAAAATRQVDNDHAPAAVEKVFQTLALGGFRAAKLTALALHGDARFTNGEVEIVRADRILGDNTETNATKGDQEFVLPSADMEQSLVARLGSGDLRGEGVDHAAASAPCATALALDGGGVQLEARPLQSLRLGLAAQWNVALTESARQNLAANAEFVRKLLHRSAGEVALDEIVEIRDFDFAGHVFDLQSVTGWILAGGIVISNCRCAQGIVRAKARKAA